MPRTTWKMSDTLLKGPENEGVKCINQNKTPTNANDK